MSSRAGHLEPAEGRELVYCHGCSNEWYREGSGGLQCPRCAGDITEIVDPHNDPRFDVMPPLVGAGSPGMPFPPTHHFDSDPEEGDIEEHMRRVPGSFHGSQRANHSARRGGNETGPASENAILTRFAEMIAMDFGMPPDRRADSPPVFRSGPGFHSTTFARTSPMGATTTFTIATGPVRGGGPGLADFNSMFPGLLRDVEIPGQGDGRGHPGGPHAAGDVIGASLRDLLLAFVNPGAALHGDAVFTQEALDGIITRLMEQNPLSNAAPPASEDAINRLERKKADERLLGEEGRAECTICIDEIKLGDEVMALPCKHWFHPDCVTLWLKEHNTCPICRTSIESGSGAGAPRGPAQSSQTQQSTRQSPRQRPAVSPRHSGYAAFASYPPSPQRTRPDRFASLRENEERLQSIRNLADPRSTSNQSAAASSGHRRTSLSPPTQRTYSSELASRARVRSPSTSRDRDGGYVTGGGSGSGSSSSGRPRGNSGAGGGGGGGGGGVNGASNNNPISWLRNTLSRNRENPPDDHKRSS